MQKDNFLLTSSSRVINLTSFCGLVDITVTEGLQFRSSKLLKKINTDEMLDSRAL